MDIQHIVREVLLEEMLLLEGPHDPGRLKAIFMAGAPGSGKGTALRTIFGTDTGFTPQGLRIVNADTLFELLMKKKGLPAARPRDVDDDEVSRWRSETAKLQQRALGKVTGGRPGISPQRLGLDPEKYGVKTKKEPGPKTQLERYVDARLGLVIDGTASNYDRVIREKAILEDLGYETMMLAVSVPLEQALAQNKRRGESGGRAVHTKAVESQWKKLQGNFEKYKNDFGMFVIVDEDNPASSATAQVDKFLRQ